MIGLLWPEVYLSSVFDQVKLGTIIASCLHTNRRCYEMRQSSLRSFEHRVSFHRFVEVGKRAGGHHLDVAVRVAIDGDNDYLGAGSFRLDLVQQFQADRKSTRLNSKSPTKLVCR